MMDLVKDPRFAAQLCSLMCTAPLQRFRFGSTPDAELNRGFGTVANTRNVYIHIWVNGRQLSDNVQRVYVVRWWMNPPLPVMGNLNGQLRHLSTQSAQSNIMVLSTLGFLSDKFRHRHPLA